MDAANPANNNSAENADFEAAAAGSNVDQKVSNRPVSLLPRNSLVDSKALTLSVPRAASAVVRAKAEMMNAIIKDMAATTVRPKDVADARPKSKGGLCIRGTLLSVTPSRRSEAMAVTVMVGPDVKQAVYNLDELGALVFDSAKYCGAMFRAFTRERITPEQRNQLIRDKLIDAKSKRVWNLVPTAVAVLQGNAIVRATIFGKKELVVGGSVVPRGTPVTLTRVSVTRTANDDGGGGGVSDYSIFAEGIEVGMSPMDPERVFTEALRRSNIVPPFAHREFETLASVPEGLSFTALLDGDELQEPMAPSSGSAAADVPPPVPPAPNMTVEELDTDGNLVVVSAPSDATALVPANKRPQSTALAATHRRRVQSPKHDVPVLYVGSSMFVVHANMPAHEQHALNLGAPRPYVTVFGRVTLNLDNKDDFFKKNEQSKEEHAFGRIDVPVKQQLLGASAADSTVLVLPIAERALPEMTGIATLEVQKQLARFVLAHYRGDIVVNMRTGGAETAVEGLGQSMFYEMWVDTVSLHAIGTSVAAAGFELQPEQVRTRIATDQLRMTDAQQKALHEAARLNPLRNLDSDAHFGSVINITQSRFAMFDIATRQEMAKLSPSALGEFFRTRASGPLIDLIRADTHRFFVVAAFYKNDEVFALENELRQTDFAALCKLNAALTITRKLPDNAPQAYKDMLSDADANQESKLRQIFAVEKSLLEPLPSVPKSVTTPEPAAAAVAAAANGSAHATPEKAPKRKASRTDAHDDAASTANGKSKHVPVIEDAGDDGNNETAPPAADGDMQVDGELQQVDAEPEQQQQPPPQAQIESDNDDDAPAPPPPKHKKKHQQQKAAPDTPTRDKHALKKQQAKDAARQRAPTAGTKRSAPRDIAEDDDNNSE